MTGVDVEIFLGAAEPERPEGRAEDPESPTGIWVRSQIRGLEKKRLSSGLPSRLSVIFSGIWDYARRGVLQSAFNLFD
jgi:hypothetical protein